MRETTSPWVVIGVPLGCCGALAGALLTAAGLLPAQVLRSLPEPADLPAPPRFEAREQEVTSRSHTPSRPLQQRSRRIPPSDLPFRLRGTLSSEISAHAMAAVEDERAGTVRSARVGDWVADAQVVSIQRGRVLLLRGGGYEELRVGSARRQTMGRPHAAPPRAPRSSLTVDEVGPNSYRVSRSELERLAAEEGVAHMRDIRVMPAFENGRAWGFRLAFVREGSLFAQLGLRQGDVIRRVNGRALDSPEKALEVYSELRAASRIDLELDRGGATTRLSYRLDGA